MKESFQTIFVLVLCISFLATNSQNVTAAPPSDIGTSFAKLSYQANPAGHPTGISIEALRLTVNNINYTASAEALGYTIVTPPNNNQGYLGCYFGYFQAEADFNIGQSQVTSIDASLLELLVNFFSIFIYYDRNGEMGYQYNLGDNFDCSNAPSTDDCVDWEHTIQLKNLSWAPITHQVLACPPGYSSSCKAAVFVVTTSGSDAGIITFAFKLASQPVYIDGFLVTPDIGKIDITINFPWQRFSSVNNTGAKIGLLAAAAGKTVSSSATYVRRNNIPGIEFAASSTKAGAFQWEETSTISKRSVSSSVYFQNITGGELDSYCKSHVCTGLLFTLLVAVDIWELLDWEVAFLFFSWGNAQPNSVYWDPTIGLSVDTTTPPTGAPTGAPPGAPTVAPPTAPPTAPPSLASGLVASVFLSSLFVGLISLLI